MRAYIVECDIWSRKKDCLMSSICQRIFLSKKAAEKYLKEAATDCYNHHKDYQEVAMEKSKDANVYTVRCSDYTDMFFFIENVAFDLFPHF